MEAIKVLEVIGIYRKVLEKLDVTKADYPHGQILNSSIKGAKHCLAMLDKMEGFIQEGRMDKVYRWLGFVQGFLWSNSFYTLDQLKDHNRKTEHDPSQSD